MKRITAYRKDQSLIVDRCFKIDEIAAIVAELLSRDDFGWLNIE